MKDWAWLFALCMASATAQTPAAAPKVLRLSFPIAETGFDPARIVDLYSRTVTPHIFEGLYQYDHLARPAKIKPLTADGMPQVSEDFRTWTVKVKPGIYFASDSAFKGKKRELVAADYVYSFKRVVDPANKSPVVAGIEETKFVGLNALRDEAIKNKKPFNYEVEVEGIKALDRYTIQFKLEQPRPRLLETLAAGDLFGAVAREVIEAYGDDTHAHPVGTGPFRLAQWRRASLIVLERNPDYREVRWEADPPADDAYAQKVAARFTGKRIPMIDRVEISIIAESQPRWLAFLNGQLDFINVPGEFVNVAMPGGKLAPHLAKRGIQGFRQVNADSGLTYFNMEDPLLGGYTPDKVALRRAISLGADVEREIRIVRRGQGMVAQSPVLPHTSGYDPKFKSEMGDYNPARAKALLDLYGYTDQDGDGWRDMPDGQPLVLEIATQPDQSSRQFDELWKRNMEAIGLKVKFFPGQWPEQLKQARAGKLMMWQLASSAAAPDGQDALQRLYGPQSGSQNLARFKNAEFDKIYERMIQIPDGPERDALFDKAKRIAVAYMPYKHHVHRFNNDLVQPRLVGFRRTLFWQEWYHMVDIDDAAPH
jgi:ABC-type transport system substrate-binding protein